MDKSGHAVKRYAVIFRERGGRAAAGSLHLAGDRLVFTGGTRAHPLELTLALADISSVRIGRTPAERLNGYRTLVLERVDLPPVEVALLETGLLHELADLLAVLTAEEAGTGDVLAVVVPLKAGSLARARQLLAQGPPVDPGTLGLTSHHVYLRESEAIFVFQGPDAEAVVGRAMRKPALWRAGMDWQHCIAGRPDIHKHTRMLTAADTPAYTWSSPTA